MNSIKSLIGRLRMLGKKESRLTHLKNQIPIMERRLKEMDATNPMIDSLYKERSDLHIQLVRLGYTPTWSDGYGTKY